MYSNKFLFFVFIYYMCIYGNNKGIIVAFIHKQPQIL